MSLSSLIFFGQDCRRKVDVAASALSHVQTPKYDTKQPFCPCPVAVVGVVAILFLNVI